MLTCTITSDKELIRNLITDNRIWKYCSEDGADKEKFIVPDYSYFILKDDNEVRGGCALRFVSSTCAELHTFLLPEVAGRGAEIFNLFCAYLLENTSLVSLVTLVPSYNKRAKRAAIAFGFTFVGTLHNSYLKNGKLIDQDIFEVAL